MCYELTDHEWTAIKPFLPKGVGRFARDGHLGDRPFEFDALGRCLVMAFIL